MQITITPFRIAEGEQTPESCDAKDAEGFRVTLTPANGLAYDRPYYYRKRKDAARAAADLAEGRSQPLGLKPGRGFAWWTAAANYLA
jgi:hypothetical protein